MGLLDTLKSLIPKSEPMPWDAQSISHPLFTLRLPEGWRFTRADLGSAAALGPTDQSIELCYSGKTENSPATPQEIEKARPKTLELMRMLVKHDAQFKSAPAQSVLPSGVLWTEATETRGKEQCLVVYLVNMRPRTGERPARTGQLCLRASIAASSGDIGAERLEALRAMLRNTEWN